MVSTSLLSEKERMHTQKKRSNDLSLHYEMFTKQYVSLIVEITDSQNHSKPATL